jgi:diguanylate cyclase (GGDEF)-like protein
MATLWDLMFRPTPDRPAPRVALGTVVLLFAAYVLVGKVGLRLAFAYPSATPVWPATGLALTALLVLGWRFWPAIFVGAFVVNITTAGTVLTSLGIATGNTLEAVVAAWLVQRFAGGREWLARTETIVIYAVVAALLSTTLSASFGVASLHLAGFLPAAEFKQVWITWWLGDSAADLLVAPVLLAWLTPPTEPMRWPRALETAALFVALLLVAGASFGGLSSFGPALSAPTFFSVPFLTWAAVRLGLREAATATLLLGVIAIWGTLNGHGGFARLPIDSSLVMLQAYMAVASVMTLMLAAAVTQRKQAEARLQELAITDPLTGIANYRHLIATMEAEIERSERTGRPFAVLFMDVDGLKLINDRYGHIVGSRALCRVAEVLRASARVVDTAARYGGDEFALLLPESGVDEAAQVARRLTEQLAASTESPPVRVSLGVAIHPADGATPDALLGVADRQLYQGRSRARGELRSAPTLPPLDQ